MRRDQLGFLAVLDAMPKDARFAPRLTWPPLARLAIRLAPVFTQQAMPIMPSGPCEPFVNGPGLCHGYVPTR
jgi:hypothetical protein